MAKDSDGCIFCDKVVTESNSPSSSSQIGPYKICDPCANRLCETSNDDDDDDSD